MASSWEHAHELLDEHGLADVLTTPAPVELTDEMVERAARVLYRIDDPPGRGDPGGYWRDAAREALTAALRQEGQADG